MSEDGTAAVRRSTIIKWVIQEYHSHKVGEPSLPFAVYAKTGLAETVMAKFDDLEKAKAKLLEYLGQ